MTIIDPFETKSESGGIVDPFALPAPATSMSWSDVPGQALSNAPHSAMEFGKAIVQPFMHPIETAKSIKNIGHGALQKAGVMSGDEDIKYADALGGFVKDRYGGMEQIKKTLATDPVGAAADLSMAFTGGSSALARAPGYIGRAGEAAGAVGRAVDPINAAGKAVKGAAKVGSEVVGGLSGLGGKGIEAIAEGGYQGGSSAKSARETICAAMKAPHRLSIMRDRGLIRSSRIVEPNIVQACMTCRKIKPFLILRTLTLL